ncbi:MAG: peptidyl-prolyl cis-trans isomerase, partial [Proteobacteria bacterium]|nr:peptidyl-prolyl cis-trans isomerase [Pseudomonadota bacterium]
EISEVKQLGNNYYLIKVVETIEPALQPLETVKESIVLTLGLKLRKQAAKEAAQALSKKAEAAGTIEQLAAQNNLDLHATTPFTRSQPVEGIGNAPELVAAAFGLDKENPIHSEVLEAGQNFYIIGYKEKLLPEEAAIENALGKTKEQITWMKQGQYFAAWVEELKSKTKIQINSELLD